MELIKGNNGSLYLVNKDSVGGCLQGEIEITYEELVKKLGEPNREADKYKTSAEWEIHTPYGVGYIYDYKMAKCYCGDEDGLDTEDITEWHIGGNNRDTANAIISFLEQK